MYICCVAAVLKADVVDVVDDGGGAGGLSD